MCGRGSKSSGEAEGEGKKEKPTGAESCLHLFTLQTIVQIFCVRAWGRHLGFQEDVARDPRPPAPRLQGHPHTSGGEGGWGSGMHHPGEGCHGPCGAHRRGLSLGRDGQQLLFRCWFEIENRTWHLMGPAFALWECLLVLTFSSEPRHELKKDIDGLTA